MKIQSINNNLFVDNLQYDEYHPKFNHFPNIKCFKYYLLDIDPSNYFEQSIYNNEAIYVDDNQFLHSTQFPAFTTSAHSSWWKHGKLHRENGPAQNNIWFHEGIIIPVNSIEEYQRYIKLKSFL
jgi:hypothetical protein